VGVLKRMSTAVVALALVGCQGGRSVQELPQAAGTGTTGLAALGPLHPGTGFPLWYEDKGGTRLQLCIPNDPLCGAAPDGFDPTQPVRFPSNFPDESFYFLATATANLSGSARVDLTLAMEAAFAGAGVVQAGQRITFARLRIRGFNLPAGTYRITHPSGVDTFDVPAVTKRNINFTDDVLPVPEVFDGALGGRVGPFLQWDAPAPDGTVGDPGIDHAVVGSAFDTNFLEVERLDPASGQFVQVAFTDRFAILGRRSVFEVVPSVDPGTFGTPQLIALVSTEPGASIFFTTDGSEPTAASTPYAGPIPLVTTTTLKTIAIASDGTASVVRTGTYVIQPAMLTVAATPGGGVFSAPQSVTLAANDPTARIFFTLDGSDPTPDRGTAFSGPISLAQNGDVALRFIAVPLAGDTTAVQTERYSIRVPILTAGTTDPANGYPSVYTDRSGVAVLPCLDPAAVSAAGAPLCVLPAASPTFDPARPIVFPSNFPDESFYFLATSQLDVPATATSPGGTLKLTLALEAAFASGDVQAGQQITFGRVRIRCGGLEVGRYRIVHPYGADFFDVTDSGPKSINFTEDVLPVPGSFTGTEGSRIGPFLSWDPNRPAVPGVPDAAPAGFLGIPGVLHPVVGSPLGTNFLSVQRWDGTTWQEVARTDAFDVMGKTAPPRDPPPPPLTPPPPPAPGGGGGGGGGAEAARASARAEGRGRRPGRRLRPPGRRGAAPAAPTAHSPGRSRPPPARATRRRRTRSPAG
jgi:hypothetical protein